MNKKNNLSFTQGCLASVRWLKGNLFYSVPSAVVSFALIYCLCMVFPAVLDWLILDANIVGDTKEACTGDGACWVYIKEWFGRLIYGMYPSEQQWRINLCFVMIPVLLVIAFWQKYILTRVALYFLFLFVAFFLLSGGHFGLLWVETGAWGGIALTCVITVGCFLVALPFAFFVALGRASCMPVIKFSAMAYISICRGIPFIIALFAAATVFPILLPKDMYVDKLVRVFVVVVLLLSGYMADIFYAALQMIAKESKGQHEDANFLGLRYWKNMLFVTMPHVLQLSLPSLVDIFIDLLKATPLIFVVGLLEFVGMLNFAKTDPGWLGFAMEGCVFCALCFWPCCFALSRYSRYLKKTISGCHTMRPGMQRSM